MSCKELMIDFLRFVFLRQAQHSLQDARGRYATRFNRRSRSVSGVRVQSPHFSRYNLDPLSGRLALGSRNVFSLRAEAPADSGQSTVMLFMR